MADPITEIMRAEQEFLAAATAVWREIDCLEAGPGGYHPAQMSVDLRHRERDAWRRYRDLLDAKTVLVSPGEAVADFNVRSLHREITDG